MHSKYILSGLVGIMVLLSGASCTTSPKGPEPSEVSRIDREASDHTDAPAEAIPKGFQNLAGAAETYQEAEVGFNAEPFQDSAELYTAEKRRQAEQAITNTILLLGIGPLLVQDESFDSFRFIPIAALAEAGFSDTPIKLINNLRNNKYFRESMQLAAAAQNAFNQGDYDQCIRYSQEAQSYARLSDEYVTQQLKINEAETEIAIADAKLTWASSVGARTRYPADYKQAQIAYAEARTARLTEDWNRTIEAARRVMNALTNVQETDPVLPVIEPEPAPVRVAKTEEKSSPPPAVKEATPQKASSGAVPKRTDPAPGPSKSNEPARSPSAVSPRNEKTPQAPTLPASNIGSSPRVPSLSGGNARESPRTVSAEIPEIQRRSASVSSGTSALAMGNTPPVPALSPSGVNTPRVPGITVGGPVLASSSPLEAGEEIPFWNSSASEDSLRAQASLSSAASKEIAEVNTSGLSSQYRVQSWNTSLDCFWNIAGKPWVYGDPSKWIVLYYANISKLPDPQNPHLLPSDMMLDIPPVAGEVRTGVGRWNSSTTANP